MRVILVPLLRQKFLS